MGTWKPEHRAAWRARNRAKLAAQQRAWAKANPKKTKDATRRWLVKNKDKRREIERAWEVANYEHRRDYYLRRQHGITLAEFEQRRVTQRNRCAICCRSFTALRAYLDHDHVTGRVRGLLCLNCNTALGQFADSTARLLRAARYLRVRK